MRWIVTWATLGCLLIASPASADEGEQLAPDQLPPGVTDHIRHGFDAEPLSGRKEVEGGRACYVVTATHRGQVIEIYASPDGHAFLQKAEPFTLARWLDGLAAGVIFVLLPGVVVGAAARGVVRAARGRPLSVPAGWLSAWVGTGAVMALVAFNLATVPRQKDVPVLAATCALWAAVAASLVEVVGLVKRSRQPAGSGHRWVVGCCVVMAACLALSIPLDILRIERENRHLKQLALRPQAG